MAPQGFDPDNAECPKCGGAMWDNRDDKASARSPDFKCKGDNGDCDGKVWMQAFKQGGNGNSGNGQRNGNGRGGRGGGSNGSGNGNNRERQNQEPQAPAEPVKPKLTAQERKAERDRMQLNYFGLMKLSSEQMKKIAEQAGILVTMADVHAATYSLYKLMDQKKLLEPAGAGPADGVGRPAERTAAPAPPKAASPQREMAGVSAPANRPGAGATYEERHPALDQEDDDLAF